MYLAFVLLLSCCCVALLYCSNTIVLRTIQAITAKLFLVCFDLPSSIRKIFTFSPASLAMTKTPKIWNALRFHGIFVIARPTFKNGFLFSSARPKLVSARPIFKHSFLFSSGSRSSLLRGRYLNMLSCLVLEAEAIQL